MAKSKNNVYKPSKEALERHNARITKIEKESKRIEEDYVDTYLNDLKTGNDNSQKKKEVRKKPPVKKQRTIKLPEEEIKKIKMRAKKKAESTYRKNIFRKRVKKLMPNEGEPKWAVPLGAAVTAGILVIAVIAGVVIHNATKFKTPTAEQKKYYEELTAPAVLFDETGFDTIGTAEDNYILLTGIWREYTLNKNNLLTNDYGSFVVPYNTVIERSKEVFGDFSKKVEPFNAVYNHITFNWDSVNRYFVIPASGYPSDITPEVIGIKDKSDKSILLVNYLTSDDKGGWKVIAEKEITTIKSENGQEYIYSIKEK